MTDGNGERRANATQMAKDLAAVKLQGKYIIKAVDKLTETVEREQDKRDALGNRVTALETNQAELKRVARSDKILERIGIIATAIAAFFGIST